jgi:translation initiation factor IF-2
LRKRTKTIALETGATVDDVLASCRRLGLPHAQSESSLLSALEISRVKRDLEEELQRRSAMLRRETIVDTCAGKVVERRLNATVMRRRHVTHEAAKPSESIQPSEPVQPSPGEPSKPFYFEASNASAEPFIAPILKNPVLPAFPQEAQPAAERRTAPASVQAVSPSGRTGLLAGGEPHAPRAISLISAAYGSEPVLNEAPRGPKVLGKIDLSKLSARPATPTLRRAGTALHQAVGAQTAPSPATSQTPVLVPADSAKPDTRLINKKRIVKTAAPDLGTERRMRLMRVPKKRSAIPGTEQRKTEITTPKASKRVVRIVEGVTIAELARNLGVKAAEVIKKLMGLGVMSTLNQLLDFDTATLIASDFGYTVESVAIDFESVIEDGAEGAEDRATSRPPVVTVMGHVDHGKTSLLDAIRKTNVTEQEFGGITQHIGAYVVEVSGRKISFIDTPGHEAFTAMRARGAKVTDIVVLVVAADEGVMPQTVEAIDHARAAGVPIVVAINKVDRPEANVDLVRQQLSEHGLIPEEWGGDTITVPLSARTGAGIERLLEMILLQADVMELTANANRAARGTVVESRLDRGRGPVATVLVQQGTLHPGDPFVCGASHGRVRAMLDHSGHRLTAAGPSTPVEILGLSVVPEPGTAFTAVREEAKARQVAEFRRFKQREGVLQKTNRISLEDLSERMKAGDVKELRLIVKADVHGSTEALSDSLRRLPTDEVKLDLIHTSVGAISETDVTLAATSGAIILGFNVRPEPKVAQLAEREGVEIRLYTIIYEAINDVREAMEGLLAPSYREKPLGRAQVRKTFAVQGTTVAGAMVMDGKIQRGARARLVRDGSVIWEGRVGSLKRFKDDAREVLAGYECGIGLENFNDVKPDDVIEDFEMEAVARKLAATKPEPMRVHGVELERQPRSAFAA